MVRQSTVQTDAPVASKQGRASNVSLHLNMSILFALPYLKPAASEVKMGTCTDILILRTSLQVMDTSEAAGFRYGRAKSMPMLRSRVPAVPNAHDYLEVPYWAEQGASPSKTENITLKNMQTSSRLTACLFKQKCAQLGHKSIFISTDLGSLELCWRRDVLGAAKRP